MAALSSELSTLEPSPSRGGLGGDGVRIAVVASPRVVAIVVQDPRSAIRGLR